MWQGHPIWEIILVAYVILILVISILRLMFINKTTLNVVFSGLLFVAIMLITYFFLIPDDLELLKNIILAIIIIPTPIILFNLLLPEIRKTFEVATIKDTSNTITGSSQTKENIIEAVLELSNRKIGALITIENHISLDQYADKAIKMKSAVTKELLLNIFTPLTPLHDGAVIIRGDEILVGGAYFPLSKNDSFDKTMGSRHRAALGISEETDSLTIVVSEETGDVSIAYEGILIKMTDRDKLLEYLNILMKWG